MAYGAYPPKWATKQSSTQISVSKISKRSRTFLVLLLVLLGLYLLGKSLTGDSFITPYRIHKDASEQLLLPGVHEHHIVIDGHTAVLSEVRDERIADQLAQAKMGKISMMYGEANPTYDRALQSHIDHAQLHHYPIFILRQKLLDRLWSKPAFILSVLLNELQKPDPQERLEWLFWFDADTYLINPKIPLETFLPPEPDFEHIHFLCSNDHNGLNTGAFFIRVNDWAIRLMAATLSVSTFRPEVNLRFSEQSAVEHLVQHEPLYINHSAIVPQRWYNAYMGPREWDGRIKAHKQITGNSVQEGDLLVHFSGHSETKKGRMNRFMSAYEKNRAAWQLELSETEYAEEIKEYWEKRAQFYG